MGLAGGETKMKGKNPIVVIGLVGLAIIAATGIYTLLNPEPALKIHCDLRLLFPRIQSR